MDQLVAVFAEEIAILTNQGGITECYDYLEELIHDIRARLDILRTMQRRVIPEGIMHF